MLVQVPSTAEKQDLTIEFTASAGEIFHWTVLLRAEDANADGTYWTCWKTGIAATTGRNGAAAVRPDGAAVCRVRRGGLYRLYALTDGVPLSAALQMPTGTGSMTLTPSEPAPVWTQSVAMTPGETLYSTRILARLDGADGFAWAWSALEMSDDQTSFARRSFEGCILNSEDVGSDEDWYAPNYANSLINGCGQRKHVSYYGTGGGALPAGLGENPLVVGAGGPVAANYGVGWGGRWEYGSPDATVTGALSVAAFEPSTVTTTPTVTAGPIIDGGPSSSGRLASVSLRLPRAGLSARRIRKDKGFWLRIFTSRPVTGVRADLLKGLRLLGTGSSHVIRRSARIKISTRHRLRAGRYTLKLAVTNANGQRTVGSQRIDISR
jgi:hypothetical protein